MASMSKFASTALLEAAKAGDLARVKEILQADPSLLEVLLNSTVIYTTAITIFSILFIEIVTNNFINHLSIILLIMFPD